jgi:hypothetical protein
LPQTCVDNCKGLWGVTVRVNPRPFTEPVPPPEENVGPIQICSPKGSIPGKTAGCYGDLLVSGRVSGCTTTIVICDDKASSFVLFHELTHGIGIVGNEKHGRVRDVVDRIEGCLKGIPK